MTAESVITPGMIDALIPVFKDRFGNCNLLFSFVLGKSIKLNLFGGTLRDYFRNKPSNDIDIWMEFNDQYCTVYDTKTRSFQDLLFEKLQQIFSGYIVKTAASEEVIKTDTKVWNKNKYIESKPEEELVDLDSCGATVPDYDAYKIHNDHVEYQFTFKGEPVKLDITFCNSTDDKTAWNSSACIEDSLYLELNPAKLAAIDFSSDPYLVVDQVCTYVNQNVNTFVGSTLDVKTVIDNCMHNIITILNIECFKRALKIVRFFEEECTLKTNGEKEIFIKVLNDHIKDHTKDHTEREKLTKLKKFLFDNDGSTLMTKVVQQNSKPDADGWSVVSTKVHQWTV